LLIFSQKSIFSSCFSCKLLTNHKSRAEKLSVHLIHFLVSKLTLYLIKAKIKGIKVISEYLNIAINTDIVTIVIEGIAAISVHNVGARDLNIEYQIHHQAITITNCLRLNQSNIGSSFSI
jgi:hypothetical protein